MTKRAPRKRLGSWLLLLAAAELGVGCVSSAVESIGGETHFLTYCRPSVDSCGTELICLDGVCTAPCDEDTACPGVPETRCLAAEGSQVLRCEVTCEGTSDCAALSAAHSCEEGRCRAPNPAGPIAGDGGAGNEDPPSPCVTAEAQGNEVVVLGDTFFATTHQVTAFLEDAARAAGHLPAGERYRDVSQFTNNALALGGPQIAAQYEAATADAPARIVIMNGGGADVLLGNCDVIDASCDVLTEAASAARELLSTLASDGVSAVVYAFYPDAMGDVREKMDVLRPLIESACKGGPAPCHWVDLRPVFAGHPEYLQPDGLNPTDAGARATADAIWAALTASCVAP